MHWRLPLCQKGGYSFYIFFVTASQQKTTPETTPDTTLTNIIQEFAEPALTNVFDLLPFEILYEIFNYIRDPRDLARLAKACKMLKHALQDSFILERRESLCFHSKRSYQDDVLGVGICLDYHPKYPGKFIENSEKFLGAEIFNM
jgi:hypothetical protein